MTITEQAVDLAPPGAAVTITGQLAVIDLVGAEGYTHGWVCVRPPCGPKPRLTTASLIVQKDGAVVHKNSGWAVGSLAKHPKFAGWFVARKADGKETTHTSKAEALKAIVTAANKNQGEGTPAPKTEAPTMTAPAPKSAPAPVKTKVPPEAAAATPAAQPATAGGKERSGAAVWKTTEGTADLSPAEEKSIARVWYGTSFHDTQRSLRNGGYEDEARGRRKSMYGIGSTDKKVQQQYDAINVFKQAIAKAEPFASKAILYRGISHAGDIFGPPGSMTGKTFTDKGFTSTTTNDALPKHYTDLYDSGSPDAPALVNVHAPAGTRALKVTDQLLRLAQGKDYNPRQVASQQEYTLAPGTTYKILADAIGPDGVRRVDVEVQ